MKNYMKKIIRNYQTNMINNQMNINFADIKTYIKTCYRNGINPTSVFMALMDDKP